VLRAIATLAAPRVSVALFAGLAELPHFNPDLDGAQPPAGVAAWRAQVAAADGILLSTPEYAHGVPGTLKNALDWLVSGIEIVDKPVAIINPRPAATWASASLKETLTVMGAKVIPEASVALPLETNRVDETILLADPRLHALLRNAVEGLIAAILQRRPDPPIH